MTRRWLLWSGFAVVHILLIWLCLAAPGQPIGDVTGVYLPWVQNATNGGPIPGVDVSFVYPILAIVPMLLPLLAGPAWYGFAWLVLVSILNAIAFGVLVGNGASKHRSAAAWWWLGFLVLLGPIALGRIDSVTVPIAILGLLWAAGRPRRATILLTLAAWMKIWPAALVAALVIALRRRLVVLLTAVATALAVLVVGFAIGGSHVLSFVTEQTGRGLQVESPIGNVYLWMAVAGVPGSGVYYDHQILTFQVSGPAEAAVASIMTPILAVAVLAIVLIGVLAMRAGRHVVQILPALALAFVLTLIVFNKVGSPQFVTWLAAPVILGIVYRGRRFATPALIALGIAGLTQLFYPYLYLWLLGEDPAMVTVLTLRNLLYFALLGWAVWSLVVPPRVELVVDPERPGGHAARAPRVRRGARSESVAPGSSAVPSGSTSAPPGSSTPPSSLVSSPSAVPSEPSAPSVRTARNPIDPARPADQNLE
ncbi:glycosyltransferase 87 family protein [Plantibacter sp. YIM 135347]|uniref:glycosyltransferase 87 family protein n=1 Tax=Plantibacter sp. YIM 135347 TaxID=3423919 RepID=UPI003D324B99